MDVVHLGAGQGLAALAAGAAQLGVQLLDVSRCETVQSDRADPGHDISAHQPSVVAEGGGLSVGAHCLQPLTSEVHHRAPSAVTQPAGIDVHLRLDQGSARFAFSGKPANTPLASPAIWAGWKVDPVKPRVSSPADVLGHFRPLCPLGTRPEGFVSNLCPRPYQGAVTRTPSCWILPDDRRPFGGRTRPQDQVEQAGAALRQRDGGCPSRPS